MQARFFIRAAASPRRGKIRLTGSAETILWVEGGKSVFLQEPGYTADSRHGLRRWNLPHGCEEYVYGSLGACLERAARGAVEVATPRRLWG